MWVLGQNNSTDILPQLTPEEQAELEEEMRLQHDRDILYESEKKRREEEERIRNETELERIEEELKKYEDAIIEDWKDGYSEFEDDIIDIEQEIPDYINDYSEQDFNGFWDYVNFFRYAINLVFVAFPTIFVSGVAIAWNLFLNAGFNRMWA